MTYVVRVIVEHDGKKVFEEAESFNDGESRDHMRAFLKEIGSGIESYDIHFESDEDDYEEEDE